MSTRHIEAATGFAPDVLFSAANYHSILKHQACLACAAPAQRRPQAEIFDAFGALIDYKKAPDSLTCRDGRLPD